MTRHPQGTQRAAAGPTVTLMHGRRCAASAGLAAFLSLVLISGAGAVRAPDNPTDAGFVIPGAGAVTMADPALSGRLDQGLPWQAFRSLHGDWSAMWNARTGSPHRAMGPAIALAGFADRADRVEAAVRAFIAAHPDLFGSPVLETVRVQKVREVWYVGFRQTVRDLPILFADWEFRVGSNGNLMTFGADAERLGPADVPLAPRLPAAVVREAARAGLAFDPTRDRVEGGETLALLPVATEQGTAFRVVAEARVRITDPPSDWRTLVDAATGEVLLRQNQVRNAISGTVTGTVHPLLPTDPLVSQPLRNLTVHVGASAVNTNLSGAYSASPGGSVTVTAALKGPFSDVNRQDGVADASFSSPATDPATVNIAFNSGNSHDAERDGFANVNFVHDYVLALDPGATNLNYVAPTNVNIAATCNAFYDGADGSVNFYVAGGGCPNTATMPDVVYHEYGHGVNEHIYYLAGQPSGMNNAALHEGMADVLAAMIQDTSHMGKGFFGPGTVLRELANTARWPQDARPDDPHITGMIIGGAFWDLRVSAGLAVASTLSHFAKYGTPDDLDDGVAMNEFFVESLVADDDDANLGNGTPHGAEIVAAFNAHGIGTVFYIHFAHTPLADQPGTGPYPVTATVSYDGPFGGLAGAPSLFYAFNNGAFTPAAMTPTGNPNEYTASIPGSSGAAVRYYFGATDTYGQTSTEPAAAPLSVHRFVAGPATTLESRDMETNPGWTVGAPDDDATTGIWEWTDPNGTQVTSGVYVQPEDDHTSAGFLCWVTGNGPVLGGAGINDVDDGKTTLTSGQFDADPGGYVHPLVSYWRWYSNNQGNSPGEDFWRVDISNDGGINWVSVENTRQSDASWQRVVFRIEDYVAPTSFMRLRFVAEDAGAGSLVEAAVDDFDLLAFSNLIGVGDPPTPRALSLTLGSALPARGALRLDYALPAAGEVSLRLYDLGGRAVRTLVAGAAEAGSHSVEWDGRDDRGVALPSGTYFARLTSGGAAVSRTLIRTR